MQMESWDNRELKECLDGILGEHSEDGKEKTCLLISISTTEEIFETNSVSRKHP